ncbi:MAG TPA: hypothetical protein DEA44_11760 [Firmicutes bacterium]|nr:hypothetical protein [Bacillota bacterium]
MEGMIVKLSQEVKKYIERQLSRYPLDKKALAQARQDIYLQHSAGGYADFRRSGTRGNSIVESKVMKLLDNRDIRQLEHAIAAVEDVLAELSAAQRRLVELKYFKDRDNQLVADELNISLRTFYHWRDKVLAVFAVRYGFI